MALPRIVDKRIEEIEDWGLDDDRFFIHLKPGYDWGTDPHQVTRSRSFGSRQEAIKWLKEWVKPVKKENI